MFRSNAEPPEQSHTARRAAIAAWLCLLWLLAAPVTAQSARADSSNDRQAELSALVGTLSDWIVGHTRFPETELPVVQFKTQDELKELCFPGFSHDLLPSIRGAYDARAMVVYLSTEFDADSALNISYLLHELVHHFQVQNPPADGRGSKSAMEAEAIRVQLKWLEQNGVQDGMTKLGVDENTLRMLEGSPR
ncbi:DUF6647 family protein [Marinobacter sp. F4206]|uniref:DUF6647 family protein n=1 Tax=Marinobacter sp. F4206 TaxID=2861777 RepID=UPI001C5E5E86|nr:DUF6647 family protein [Marinobacter sp. F4206]MBW4934963.1 hypothetical protein [Marinobacter sp. F4206]